MFREPSIFISTYKKETVCDGNNNKVNGKKAKAFPVLNPVPHHKDISCA
jgi:hypothetical protein